MRDLRPRLQGIVVSITRTGEKKTDSEGNVWEKCIFEVKLTGFSKRTPDKQLPRNLRNAQVRIIRWCCFDWHYKIGVRVTLTPNETQKVLSGKLDLTEK